MENALRRFKRKVQQEDIIKEVKRHSFYLKPGEKLRAKQALARKRNRKKITPGDRVNAVAGRKPRRLIRPQFRLINGAEWPMAEFQDRVLKCVDCGADFVFTAGEQHFFHDKNFKNEPKRCKACKTKRQGASGIGFCQNGNHDHLLAMRPGNHGALQADSRPAGLLPRVLLEP